MASIQFMQRAKLIFEQYCAAGFASSTRFAGAFDALDDLLILGDRVLAACQFDLKLSGAYEVGPALGRLADEDGADTLEKDLIEYWLKAVRALAAPDKAATDPGPRDNWYQALLDLDLLGGKTLELSRDKAAQIEDPVERWLFLAREDRNPEAHDPARPTSEVEARRLPSRLATLLAALHVHREALTHALRALVTRPLDVVDLRGALAATREERDGHLRVFKGRREELRALTAALHVPPTEPGRWIVLVANEGSGKSALAARVSQELAVSETPIGRDAASVSRQASWLPGALFHSGKACRSHLETGRLLIAQANSLLLHPLKVAPPEGGLSLEGLGTGLDGLGAGISSQPRFRPPRGRRDDGERVRWTLAHALTALVSERGFAMVILDAIDEMSAGEPLSFLPEHLPPGVGVLVTGREGSALAEFLRVRPGAQRFELGEIQKADLPEFLGTTDPRHAEFNDRAWEATRGWAHRLHRLRIEIVKASGEPRTDMLAGTDEILQRQAELWNDPTHPGVLEATLALLTVFEPRAAVSLDSLEAYIEEQDVSISRPQLRASLRRVEDQLEGRVTGRLKLSNKLLAEHCASDHLGPRGLAAALRRVADWIVDADDDDCPPELVAGFLDEWWEPGPQAPRAAGVAAGVVEAWRGAGKAQRLLDVWRERRDGGGAGSLAALRAAADLELPEGLRRLGRHELAEGDSAEGERLLLAATDAGDQQAVLQLAGWHLSEITPTAQPRRGEALLRDAVARGSMDAAALLGEHLLQGADPAAAQEAEALLRPAIASGDLTAAVVLGTAAATRHTGVDASVEEGESWLVSAADGGVEVAKFVIGALGVDGCLPGVTVDRAIKMLRESVRGGSPEAAAVLGEKLIRGDRVPADPEEGARLLEIAGTTMPEARCALGFTLASVEVPGRTAEEGLSLLRELDSQGVPGAAGRLGFLDLTAGRILEGRVLLEEAAGAGDDTACALLAAAILEGMLDATYASQVDELLNPRLLRTRPGLHLLRARAILDGRIEGTRHDALGALRRAADMGHGDALRDLAALLQEEPSPEHDAEAERRLRRWYELDGDVARLPLAEFLLERHDEQGVPEEAIELLRAASDDGDRRARMQLVGHLLETATTVEARDEAVSLVQGKTDDLDDRTRRLLIETALADPPLVSDPGSLALEEGYYAYLSGDWEAASQLFHRGFLAGEPVLGGNNLAYMLRRAEVSEPDDFPSIDELLSPGLEAGDEFARLNHILHLIAAGTAAAWRSADLQIADLDKQEGLLGWWGGSPLEDGDPEAMLVTAWLSLHGGPPLAKSERRRRLEVALAGGWAVPAWLLKR